MKASLKLTFYNVTRLASWGLYIYFCTTAASGDKAEYAPDHQRF